MNRNRLEYATDINVAEIVDLISRGVIQVPEFMSHEFIWGEEEIINLLDYFYYGFYRTNILLIGSGIKFSKSQNGSLSLARDFIIPSKRLYREISKKGFKSPNSKAISQKKEIFYIVDGYHRLQSLYLAWHGFFNGKRLYFKISAMCEEPFYFLKPADRNPNLHERLSDVKNVRISGQSGINQVEKNCEQFKEMFLSSKRISFDFIDMNDPFLDQLLSDTLDKKPDTKVIADRIRFIKENYISNDEE